jgi:hypothetical protein
LVNQYNTFGRIERGVGGGDGKYKITIWQLDNSASVVVTSEEELNVAVVVEASVWLKRSERSGSGDSVRDFRMAIVPPRTGREDSVPHMMISYDVVDVMRCWYDTWIGVGVKAGRQANEVI